MTDHVFDNIARNIVGRNSQVDRRITEGQTEYDPLKGSTNNPLDVQEGGNHYKKCKIQPIEYIHANGIGYLEGNVIKYVTRHQDKNLEEDIKKAIHYLELILEMEYGGK